MEHFKIYTNEIYYYSILHSYGQDRTECSVNPVLLAGNMAPENMERLMLYFQEYIYWALCDYISIDEQFASEILTRHYGFGAVPVDETIPYYSIDIFENWDKRFNPFDSMLKEESLYKEGLEEDLIRVMDDFPGITYIRVPCENTADNSPFGVYTENKLECENNGITVRLGQELGNKDIIRIKKLFPLCVAQDHTLRFDFDCFSPDSHRFRMKEGRIDIERMDQNGNPDKHLIIGSFRKIRDFRGYESDLIFS